jgi:hypothetical protein
MRFLLSFRLLAMLPACLASLGGKLTLWRTDFSAVFMAPLCTKMVQVAFERPLGRFAQAGTREFLYDSGSDFEE